MRVLLLDNYDSFTWNLHDLMVRAGWAEHVPLQIDVIRNDQTTVEAVVAARYAGLVISPGPKAPDDAGICLRLLEAVLGRLPVFGVCLGHQALAQVLGARVVRGREPVHGKVAAIGHRSSGCFVGAPQPMTAMRYHSLIVDPAGLDSRALVHAWLADEPQVVMGLCAPALRAESVQFHPESVGTPLGLLLMRAVVRDFGQSAGQHATTAA